MKKVFMMLAAAVCTLAATATEYTGKLTVDINGEGVNQATAIQVSEVDGKYNLDLNNFMLIAGEDSIGVGNINIAGLEGTTEFGFTNITFNGGINITNGDAEGVSMWLGPNLGEVPLVMKADFNNQALSVNIDIDMTESLGQVIKVNFVGVAPAAEEGIKGDVNKDGNVDVSDVNEVINIMLGK